MILNLSSIRLNYWSTEDDSANKILKYATIAVP